MRKLPTGAVPVNLMTGKRGSASTAGAAGRLCCSICFHDAEVLFDRAGGTEEGTEIEPEAGEGRGPGLPGPITCRRGVGHSVRIGGI